MRLDHSLRHSTIANLSLAKLGLRPEPGRIASPKFSGGDIEEAIPDPIPNSEVKLLGADGTAWVTVWESRSLPGLFSKASPFTGSRPLLFCPTHFPPNEPPPTTRRPGLVSFCPPCLPSTPPPGAELPRPTTEVRARTMRLAHLSVQHLELATPGAALVASTRSLVVPCARGSVTCCSTVTWSCPPTSILSTRCSSASRGGSFSARCVCPLSWQPRRLAHVGSRPGGRRLPRRSR